jgi:hypothetical protein
MKKVLLLLACLMTLTSLPWCAGCGGTEKKVATPQQMEEYRQKNIERAKRMQEQGSKR